MAPDWHPSLTLMKKVSFPTPSGVVRPLRRGLAGRGMAEDITIELIGKLYKINYMVSNVKACQ
jgi:hypothetical protein